MTISTLILVSPVKVFWRADMARIIKISRLRPFKKPFLVSLVCWWWCSLIVVVRLRKYFILFLICIFLGYRVLTQLYFSQHFKMWCQCPLTLFHMPNLLSFPFFVLLCLFFLLVTFLWLIVLSHELWCAFVELSYFLYLN